MARKLKIESKCEKCGKPQPKDESKSNENWSVLIVGKLVSVEANSLCILTGIK